MTTVHCSTIMILTCVINFQSRLYITHPATRAPTETPIVYGTPEIKYRKYVKQFYVDIFKTEYLVYMCMCVRTCMPSTSHDKNITS